MIPPHSMMPSQSYDALSGLWISVSPDTHLSPNTLLGIWCPPNHITPIQTYDAINTVMHSESHDTILSYYALLVLWYPLSPVIYSLSYYAFPVIPTNYNISLLTQCHTCLYITSKPFIFFILCCNISSLALWNIFH